MTEICCRMFFFYVQKLCFHSHPLLGYKSVIQSGQVFFLVFLKKNIKGTGPFFLICYMIAAVCIVFFFFLINIEN